MISGETLMTLALGQIKQIQYELGGVVSAL